MVNLDGLAPVFLPPFRVGRKQMRAVLDAKGIEVVIFPRGLESYAKEYADFLNSTTAQTDANIMLAEVKCTGVDGLCCCNCKNQIELRRHPMNTNFGKGSIMEGCGWVCLAHELTEGKCGIYFDRQHGMCEFHVRR